MKELSAEAIRDKALKYHADGLRWHFHVLTPTCKFNAKSRYAFVLEGPEGNFAHYSDAAPNELGLELAPLAHKADVLNAATADADYQPSEAVARIIARAKELIAKRVQWHHHVTVPGCQFHNGDSQFTLIFEDPEANAPIEVPSDQEPINDLKQLEPLFYSQR